jgi:type IV pilus assembly protein PilA
MKTSLKANLLKHFIAKKEEGGFTLIELLVVIIIIGILAAIALPSFLNQANKAKQSEAKTYIGSINRAQQANFLEQNEYTNDITDLGLGIRSITENYQYVIDRLDTISAYATATPVQATQDAATGQFTSATRDGNSTLKAYMGLQGTGVTDPNNEANSEQTTLAVLCEAAKTPAQGGAASGADIAAVAGDYDTTVGPTCPAAFKTL